MRTLTVLSLCLGATLAAGAAASPYQSPDPAAAESLSQKLDAMRERFRTRLTREQEYRMNEGEINSYMAYRLVEQIPKGIEGLWVRLTPDVLSAGGQVDLAALKERMAGSPLTMFLSGIVPIEVRARVVAQNGVGRVELQNVLLSGIQVPRSLLQQLVTHYSKSAAHPDGVRIEDAFELPYGIRSARFLPGEVVVRQGPLESQP